MVVDDELIHYEANWANTSLTGELLPPEAAPFAKMRESGKPIQRLPLGMIRSDGRRQFFLVEGRPIYDDVGNYQGSLLTGIEATEPIEAVKALSRSERQLEMSQARYEGLYRKTPAILHSIDNKGLLLEVSDRWLETFDYERTEVIGRPSTDFLTAESAKFAREVTLPQFMRDGFLYRSTLSICRQIGPNP